MWRDFKRKKEELIDIERNAALLVWHLERCNPWSGRSFESGGRKPWNVGVGLMRRRPKSTCFMVTREEECVGPRGNGQAEVKKMGNIPNDGGVRTSMDPEGKPLGQR